MPVKCRHSQQTTLGTNGVQHSVTCKACGKLLYLKYFWEVHPHQLAKLKEPQWDDEPEDEEPEGAEEEDSDHSEDEEITDHQIEEEESGPSAAAQDDVLAWLDATIASSQSSVRVAPDVGSESVEEPPVVECDGELAEPPLLATRSPLPPAEPVPDDGLLVEAPPDTWEQAENAENAEEPEEVKITPAERKRLLAKAFAQGGEAAVIELMEELRGSL